MSRVTKKKRKRLGIVPRTLLGATIAGAAPIAVVPLLAPACSSGPEFRVDAPPQDARPSQEFFAVDAPNDAGIPDGPEFAVDAPVSDAES